MKNQVIKVLSKEHGKKVIEYWKSRGVASPGATGSKVGYYYGAINGVLLILKEDEVKRYKPEIIELPEEVEAQTTFDKLPVEIQEKMLERQVEQGNRRDEGVFRKYLRSSMGVGGFNWDDTPEESKFWHCIIDHGNLETFYQLYPKQEQEQEPIYPCEMWVWDDDVRHASKRLVEGIVANRYIISMGDTSHLFYGCKNASLTNPIKSNIYEQINELEEKINELKKQL